MFPFFHRIAWYTLTIVSYNVRIMIYSHNCETNTRNSDFFLAIQTFFLRIVRYKLAIYHAKKVYITQLWLYFSELWVYISIDFLNSQLRKEPLALWNDPLLHLREAQTKHPAGHSPWHEHLCLSSISLLAPEQILVRFSECFLLNWLDYPIFCIYLKIPTKPL